MVRVLVCDHVEIERLSLGSTFEVDYKPTLSKEDLLSVVADYEVLIVRSRTKVDREVLEKAKHLKLVARPGTGLDNIDVGYAKEKGVAVVNSPESLVEAVAEQVIMVMLALSRKLVQADVGTRSGKWEKNALIGRELKGKSLGVVGFGRIGRRIAELGKTLGMTILAYDVITIPQEVLGGLGAKVVSLDELFSSADYITLHVPMTPDTAHMVDGVRIAKMKQGSVLVNTSRGGVVDEDALASALRDGRIGGAALDVFEREPPTGAILSAPNAILTPHIGGQTEEAQINAIEVIGEKVRAFFTPH
ncbi:MAG: hydroxyacid dehydrogenase [Nitrososphaerota archaeon]|jgi:D-3-phosphoglycerate dehydrogenase|nr:hydroxyacid dehydrogenase [Nitrososphaerota archaeon]MDG6942204.1 hydroxyacid dehydrogenase [Nitrososphaerota archaeon]MDG6942669.1 hydroxyacid dehydrogenase [Nitrososphaerota archaeon]MDG6948456.1 hydroxyacid dehydrogenase [Nitrososphaerota archaeon]MDG6950382.1 hydroxyacid dehydrogenase [Nitrososphaerota archaeon]